MTALHRRMVLPEDSLAASYASEIPKVTQKLMPRDIAKTTEKMSSAFDKTWLRRDGAGDEWSTGTDGLSGCTVLYIISRIGVFAAHYFENVSFSPSKYWFADQKRERQTGQTHDERRSIPANYSWRVKKRRNVSCQAKCRSH